ncbi:hypothetical protein SAMN03159343_1880 [Klenkia marina]|uniref:Mce-associated membrane protein n=1 Tax=Klenkia marina TaxID=1960309 RepID=A0A1G4Y002_9ACTN|nr:hypothetical protein [Klenkia marina]SCX46861.1 hypothetical protein SAMN03159343_1880 [Klenkia marina]
MTDETRGAPRDPDPAEPETSGTALAVDETADQAVTPSGSTDRSADTGADESTDGGTDEAADEGAAGADRPRGSRRRRRVADEDGDGGDGAGDGGAGDEDARRSRAVLPLVPVLGALLVLLLAGTGYLLVTRPGTSSVSTDDYVDALQAARSGIVDVASFDYLTLDDDITQIEAVTTGDLRSESVDQLNSRRQDITTAQAVVNTEVVGAAVGAAGDGSATVYMVIQSTQTSSASQQAQVQRYRIEVDLTQEDGRWLLSGISGR